MSEWNNKSPGTFLIEKTDHAEGILTGATVFEAPNEIRHCVFSFS